MVWWYEKHGRPGWKWYSDAVTCHFVAYPEAERQIAVASRGPHLLSHFGDNKEKVGSSRPDGLGGS